MMVITLIDPSAADSSCLILRLVPHLSLGVGPLCSFLFTSVSWSPVSSFHFQNGMEMITSYLRLFLILFCLRNLTCAVQNASPFDPLKYVDQLIGTDNGGNVFAGATLPYGMAKAVADVNGQNTAGFSTDGSQVTGFSHMHDSG